MKKAFHSHPWSHFLSHILQAYAPIAQLVPILRDWLFVSQIQRAMPTLKAKRRFTEFIPNLVREPPPTFRLCQPVRPLAGKFNPQSY